MYRILTHAMLVYLSYWQHRVWILNVILVLTLDWTEGDKNFDKWVRALSVCMGMLMLIWKFRGFENIGFAVRMIIQVFKDLKYIGLITGLFLIQFIFVGKLVFK